MDDVERLFLIFDFDYKRYVGFGSTLSAGDHIYTVPAESVEQTSGYAGGITHVFADDSHCGKIVLRMYGIQLTRGEFGRVFFSSASTARAASSFFTANDVVFSLEACDTMNTLTPHGQEH